MWETRIIEDRQLKARKKHTCDWCCGTINKGTLYRKTRLINFDGFYTWKSHNKCEEVFSALEMDFHDDGNGIDSNEFGDCLEEYLRDNDWFFGKDYDDEEDYLEDWIDDHNYEDYVDKVLELIKAKEKKDVILL